VEWLIRATGSENALISRVAHVLRPSVVEFNPALTGWGWRDGTSSWIEPTAHAILALKRAAPHYKSEELTRRLLAGERMLLDRRCADGGWNYGNRKVLGVNLPSFPETTALALLALDASPAIDWATAIGVVERHWRETPSRLAHAWLSACLLRYRGRLPEGFDHEQPPADDILLTATEALAWKGSYA
jgi:hypothetical protein